MQGGVKLPARMWRLKGEPAREFVDFSLSGPTCDSLDILPYRTPLPADIDEGDWIEIDCLGAYSNANATRFNGFHNETWITVHDHPIGHVK